MRAPTTTGPDAVVVGVDLLTPTVLGADHLAAALVDQVGAGLAEVFTHLCRCATPAHVALSVGLARDQDVDAVRSVTGPDTSAAGALAAGQAHEQRSSGRGVHYPGVGTLTGTLSVGEVLAGSAIERVELVTGEAVGTADPLVTRDFVRPVWDQGQLLLLVDRAVGGVVVPYEPRHQIACCRDHG